MSAAATVLQLVRAHYARDESAFASAAGSLARGAKTNTIRAEILDLVRRGFQRRAGELPRREEPFRQLQPAPAPIGALTPLSHCTFAELQLEPELQSFLDEAVLELEYRDELRSRELAARNRFLFYGPPGNGKTSAAAALANALGVQAYCVSIPQVVSEFLGGTSKNLGQIFDAIRDGMVVVFDELDAIGSRRGAADQAASKEQNAVLNTMLTAFDRNRAGVIVATTNRIDIIDEALLRRFDEQINVPAPSIDQMQSLAWRLCEKYGVPPVAVSDCVNFDEVTKRVKREARRVVMKELIASDDGGESENQESSLN